MRSVASIPCADSQNKLQRTFDRFQSRIPFILKILFILSPLLHSCQCKWTSHSEHALLRAKWRCTGAILGWTTGRLGIMVTLAEDLEDQ